MLFLEDGSDNTSSWLTLALLQGGEHTSAAACGGVRSGIAEHQGAPGRVPRLQSSAHPALCMLDSHQPASVPSALVCSSCPVAEGMLVHQCTPRVHFSGKSL